MHTRWFRLTPVAAAYFSGDIGAYISNILAKNATKYGGHYEMGFAEFVTALDDYIRYVHVYVCVCVCVFMYVCVCVWNWFVARILLTHVHCIYNLLYLQPCRTYGDL